jgi:hypothetical protein
LDYVGWDVIDRKRQQAGWRPVTRMGLVEETPADIVAGGLSRLASENPVAAAVLEGAAENLEGGRRSEVFNRRQPEHVILAGTSGLGVFDAREIDFRSYAWDRGRWLRRTGTHPF